jgi:hypothetical protein
MRLSGNRITLGSGKIIQFQSAEKLENWEKVAMSIKQRLELKAHRAPAVHSVSVGFSKGRVVARVKSSDGRRYYRIICHTKFAGALECTCPAFFYGKHGIDSHGYCKHIRSFLGDW